MGSADIAFKDAGVIFNVEKDMDNKVLGSVIWAEFAKVPVEVPIHGVPTINPRPTLLNQPAKLADADMVNPFVKRVHFPV